MRRTALLLLLIFAGRAAGAEPSTLSFGLFGPVTVYQRSITPSQVVLFASGDGGWNLGVVKMAEELAGLDALVVGFSTPRYLKAMRASSGGCSYPAGDLEELSQFIQKEKGLPFYTPPVLVGYSSGATLVYAALAQAPGPTFKGAISMGFCPELRIGKPFCRGQGLAAEALPRGKGYRFLPSSHLETPWVAFQGSIDQVCTAKSVEAYVKEVVHGDIVLLPKVGHGFSVDRNWLPQFKETFGRLTAPPQTPPAPESLGDLPLIEVPAAGAGRDAFAVVVSGDGGWAGIDRELARALSEDGIPVVGINSLKYFWKRKTPEQSSKDLERVLRYYFSAWRKKSMVLVGYSRGADVLPFMVNRLPPDLTQRTALLVLLGLESTVDFEIHPGDYLNLPRAEALPVRSEIEKLKGLKIVCFYGQDETDSLCPKLPAGLAEGIPMRGGHHFGGDYAGLAQQILSRLP